MPLSIKSNGVTSVADVGSSVPGAGSPAAAGTSSITATPVKSPAVQLEAFFKSITTRFKIGNDTRDIATALRTTMQAVLAKRPDLADAKFDFVSSQGSIQVLSTELNEQDKGWLEGQLNANAALVAAVKTFHADATDVYTAIAEASDAPTTHSSEQVSDHIDRAVKFMSLFHALGSDIQSTLDQGGGAYFRTDGGALDPGRSSNSAAGFMSFMDQMQAIQDGAIGFASGDVMSPRGAFWMENPFYDAGFKLPNDVLGSGPASLGLSVKA